MSIFKACDIRGVYPDELDEDRFADLGRAMGTLLRERRAEPRALVGGDVRPSTPGLRAALLEGLASTGCHAVDLGIVPTPVVYYAARRRHPDGLAIVTASHNPPDHNGLKLCLGPMPVTPQDIARLAELADSGPFATGRGSIESLSVEGDYIAFLASQAQPGGGFPLALDCGNGVSGELAPRVLRRVGYRPVELFCEPDGTFPNRAPNPALPENLAALRRTVAAEGLPLGVALDGDGDRVAMVDDRGRSLTGDQAIILLAEHLLAAGDKAVCDIKCSRAVLDAVRARGAEPLLERSGHAFIKTRMIREEARFGGELSGHFFYRELDGGDDGLYAILRIAELVRAADRPLSAIVDAMPRYAITPDLRVPYDRPDGGERLEQIARAADGEVLRLDGVRAAYPDGWGLARLSVTEPLLTFRFEAYEDSPRAIAERFLAPTPDLRRQVLDRLDALEADTGADAP
ncbi:MAG: phosphomannomutase/phosphoglucomutase [Planctomycetota bacterium]